MLKVKEQPPLVHYFDHAHFGFGDKWSICNYILRTSEDTGCKTLITSQCWNDDISLIMRNLVSTGSFEFVPLSYTRKIDYCATFKINFCPTKNYVWTPNKSKLICYQLDGKWKSEVKNLSDGETKALFHFLRKSGYELIDVGNMRPLSESIRLLSKAEAFVGIPSGMSHVANSVGTPSYIICKASMGVPRIASSNMSDAMQFHIGCIYHQKHNVHLYNSVQELTDYLFRLSQNLPGMDCIPML